jgi:hypothetical protein
MAALVGLWLAPAEAAADQFRLTVSGSTFVDFDGECRLVADRGFETRVEIAGSVPRSYAVFAAAVSCDIRKLDVSGTLAVRLARKGAVVARASTRASVGEVSVRSAGPWGPARATVKTVPLLPRHVLPAPRSVLPPLRTPIVPPLSGQSVPPLR